MPQFDFQSFFVQSFQFSLCFCLFYLLFVYYLSLNTAFIVSLRKKISANIAEKNSKQENLLDICLRNIFIK